MPFMRTRQAEIHTALVVRLGRGWKVEIREGNLLRMLRSEVPQRPAYDGVILHFLLMLIVENQHRGRYSFRAWFLVRWLRDWARISVRVGGGAHSLLLKALRIHLIGEAYLVLLILIVGGIRIPPPVRIECTSVPPRIPIAVKSATAVPIAVVSEAISSEPAAIRTAEAPSRE